MIYFTISRKFLNQKWPQSAPPRRELGEDVRGGVPEALGSRVVRRMHLCVSLWMRFSPVAYISWMNGGILMKLI